MRYSINHLTKNAIQDEKTITLPNGIVIEKEIDADNIRFPKHDKQKTYRQLVHFYANRSTPRNIEFYIPWVDGVAREVLNKRKDHIETLTLEDLIQSGNEGLVRAWENMDWDTVNSIPEEEQQAYIWNYLKTGIKLYIIESIDLTDAFIRVPIREIKSARSQMKGAEKVYVSLFPKFFDEEFQIIDEEYSWDNERLYEFLLDLLYKHVPNDTHRAILLLSYGVDTWDNKPVSEKKIAEQYNLSPGYVRLAKHRIVKSLLENEEIQEKIKNYLQK